MTRREFTEKITILLGEMIHDREQPIIDFAMRSAEEQKRLFDKGLSKLDGITKLSNHQKGTAMDIYLCSNKVDGQGVSIDFEWNEEKSKKWHDRWCEMGGKPLIVFSNGTKDHPHFESA